MCISASCTRGTIWPTRPVSASRWSGDAPSPTTGGALFATEPPMPSPEPTTLAELLQCRWVRLATFAKLVPGMSTSTLSRWARDGKIPSSRRLGKHHWIDMAALRAQARSNEGILANLGLDEFAEAG